MEGWLVSPSARRGREQSQGAGMLDGGGPAMRAELGVQALDWVLTVFGETESSRAISGVVRLVGR
jgi:hypothetical protein